MTQRFAISVARDDYGRLTGIVPALDDCKATGKDMEEMLERLEEEVQLQLGRDEMGGDIELVGYDTCTV